ncbi:MAG: Fic family protein [Patescibacteria group bacterium]
MVGVSRYNTGGDQADILKNKLGIKDPKELEDLETLLLTDAYEHFLQLLSENKLKLNLDLFFELHDYFLGPLYTWAGKIRTVNISKGDAFFAPAQNIESALKQFESEFEKDKLIEKDSKEEIARKLASIHCELNVIHPFREGNGRTLRLFLDLLTMNVGYEAVDFKKIPDKEFIDACKHGMLQNYEPMETIYLRLLVKIAKLC